MSTNNLIVVALCAVISTYLLFNANEAETMIDLMDHRINKLEIQMDELEQDIWIHTMEITH